MSLFGFFKLFIYFWLCWVSVAMWSFLSLQQVVAALWVRCSCFSLQWLLLLQNTDSRVRSGFSSRSTWAHELHLLGSTAQAHSCAWDLPGSGIKPVSPALAGNFFTTEPPGKPCFPILE